MKKVTIIGAGAMGSALTVPLIQNGHDVRLWGTELDTDIINNLRADKPHPKHKHKVPSEIKTYTVDQLSEAMEDTEIVIMAITSDALGMIFERVVPFLKIDMIIASVSKGFNYNKNEEIVLLPEILKERLPQGLNDLPIVVVGGPCKANEVVFKSPACVVYACENIDAAKEMKSIIATDVYNIKTDTDVIGTEVAVAMKNAYAVALGFAEGFKEIEGYSHNNTKSALFTIAIEEMALLSEALGGKYRSIIGLPGVGDLEVTGEAGRNRLLGEVIGSGIMSKDALEKMKRENITVEGYPAIKFGYELTLKLGEKGKLSTSKMPLLCALYDILYRNRECYKTIKKILSEYYN